MQRRRNLGEKAAKVSILIFFYFLFSTCRSSSSLISYETKSRCIQLSNRKVSPCELLKQLSDSLIRFAYFQNHECINETVHLLAQKSGIYPQWRCNFAGCAYLSYSLKKSIFKIDLLKWMRYFHCVDTINLRKITGGNFSAEELKFIKDRESVGYSVDTTILNQ